ncbi:CAP domain-containing protein [Micromonospora sp. GCM10011542]|uniref:CAP domain-containing protein n=1 Tax=Micromonospora sp. GCM10011542 TaxID=3317337 RepID=UPI0036090738
MYGWTDPMDPDGAPRRAEPPTDEPAWLTNRPEPRSSYLFGDDPDQPGDEWHREQPTARWAEEPTTPVHPPAQQAPDWQDATPTAAWRDETPRWQAEPASGNWQPEPTGPWSDRAARTGPAEPTSGGWQTEPASGGWQAEPTSGGWQTGPTTGDWQAEPATGALNEPAGGWQAAAGDRPAEARHRSRPRWRRPVAIGGAAAAATLVVSLGVGALGLPGGDGGSAQPTAVDDTLAAAPAVPTDDAPADTLVAPSRSTSPTASPRPTRPSPSPSKVVKPTPAASRTNAASRRQRSSAPATTSAGSGSTAGVSAQAKEVVNLVNAERAKAGCKALSIDDKLMTAAQRHSQDQADHQNMSHTGSDGSNAGVRLDRVGYAWRTYGENVAWNQKTPAAVMDAWMNSSGHRANILNCAFTEIGVGIASSNGPYWTQVFAAPR